MTSDEIYQEARDQLAMLDQYSGNQQMEWLRQSFVSQHWAKQRLRDLIDELRTLVRSWPEAKAHTLTVKEATVLAVCRICWQKPTMPLILDYGREFACQKCLKN